MRVKGLIDEDFINYKNPCMFISLGTCDWKCCKEANIPIDICQNCSLAKTEDIDVPIDEIFCRYTNNCITHGVVIGGLEPLSVANDLYQMINYFRLHGCQDVFVIYTGYYENEIQDFIRKVQPLRNIVFKFGRFIPGHKPHHDDVLGVDLASDNQYGKVVC